jgi:putative ABC transport system permease protein
VSAAVSDARAVLAGSLAQNFGRTLVAGFAIALGVALGFAVQLINASAMGELTQGVRTLAGDADLAIRGPRGGFDEALYPTVARDADVAIASPVVDVDAHVAGHAEPLRVIGVDWFRAAWIQRDLVVQDADRMDTLRPDAIFLSAAALRAYGVAVGDTLAVQSGLRAVTLRVAGRLAGAGQQRLGAMDIAAAQDTFDRAGRLSRIDLRLVPGVDADAFSARLRPTLPPGLAVDPPEATLRATESVSRSYRVNLNVLALVALFTGGLLVFTTQALSVVRRRAQFALLRVLGVTARRLATLVVAEGILLGIAGSLARRALGYARARIAVQYAGGDLGSGFFRGVQPTVALDPAAMGTFAALGLAAAVLGSLVPAREAGRAPPALALKAGDQETALARLRPPWRGLAVIAAGAALAFAPPVGGLPLGGYAAIACLLIGKLLLMPWLSNAILGRVSVARPVAPALALAQLRGAPGQASVSLATIVASVSLMVSMAIMVHSFRTSLEGWLERVLPADLYFRAAAASDVAYLSPGDQARIAAIPGIARVEFYREEQLLLDPSRPRVVLLARGVDADRIGDVLPFLSPPAVVPASAPPPAWVNEAMVDLYDFAPGTAVEVPLGGRAHRFTIAGVWRDYGRPQGAIVIERERYVALTGDRSATNGAIRLASPAALAGVREALARMPGGDRLEIGSPGEIREASLRAFDRTFAVTYALEFAAVAIGLVGLSSAFGALVLARRREFGVLQHLGMTKRQVAAMLATEGFATSALGVGVGVVLGAAISLILIEVVNRQSFHWGMELAIPWGTLVLFTLAIVTLATLTAVASGRRAMSTEAVQAVREDW